MVNDRFRRAAGVACHCVIDPRFATAEGLLSKEAFIGEFPEDGPYYLDHLRAAAEVAAQSADTVFSPSGGQTRIAAPGLSEGGTHATAARAMNYWGHPEVEGRTFAEEYALTSLENVLYVIARFVQLTSRMPEQVTICGWRFKEERFLMHAQAIGWPLSRFSYVGVNNPAGKALEVAIANEARLLEGVKSDPLMLGLEFAEKRARRNPFGVRHPYRGLDGGLDQLFELMDG